MISNSQDLLPKAADSPHHYAVGTLVYDRKDLSRLFFWLLWGDFAFTFFETIFGRFMPLYLKEFNASNTLIGILTGSIAGVVNILFLPNISQWSDRFRSRLGRRIPFLLVVTPLAALCLLAIGCSPEIGSWMYKHVTLRITPSLSCAMLMLSSLGVFTVFFHFFNMVLVSSYNWLLRDVVPQNLMPRFLSLFRVVGTVASVLFLWCVFPTMLTQRKMTFLLIGGFYVVSFLLMCWMVKEGKYPEPEHSLSNPGVFEKFAGYFRNCLSTRLYRNFFIVYVLTVIANDSAISFLTLYARHTIGLEMTDMGRIYSYAAILSALAYAPMGWICEKVNAMLLGLISLPLLLIGVLLAYFLVSDRQSWLIFSLLIAIPSIGWGLATLTISMQLFPQKDFGQFASGMPVFACGGMILGNYLIGRFMDFNHSDYRMVFIWRAAFYTAAIFPMLCVYRDWKRNGGPYNYIPPV